MVIEVEFRRVFVAAYFVKTGFCSVHKAALWFGARKTHFGHHNQQKGEELEKTPVETKAKDSENFTVFVLCSCVERKTKTMAYLHLSIRISEQQISSWLSVHGLS